MPARPRSDRRLRHRGVGLVVAVSLVAGSCSGTDGITVQVEPVTPSPPTSTPTPRVAPTPSPSPEPTPTPVAVDPLEPRPTGAVVFEAGGELVRLDAQALGTPLEPADQPATVTIVDDATVLGIDGNRLLRWDASGTLVSTRCTCVGAGRLDGVIVALTDEGHMRAFTPTLEPQSSITTDLAAVADPGTVSVVGAAATGELIVVGRPLGSDDAFGIWGVDMTGAVRHVAEGRGVGMPSAITLAPDGASMAYTVAADAGGDPDDCTVVEQAFDVDLVTGDTVDRGQIWTPVSDGSVHSERAVDLFWAGDLLYLVAEVAGGTGPAGCASRWPTALWHHDGAGWTVTDSGPISALFPLSATTKVYVLSDGPGSPGDLIVETGGESTRIATDATIVAASAAQVEGDLAPAPRLTSAAAATYASLLVAAETGSATNVAEAAGAGFLFSVDTDTGDGAPPDAVTSWEARAACCGLDIAAIVGQLLTTAPLTSFDDGVTVFEWAAPDPAGWRVAIDASGRTRWIVDEVS